MKYSGIVLRGRQYGRTLGFPTANIRIESDKEGGIYAAKVALEGTEYQAAVYADQRKKTLEAHILDFDRDIYDAMITIELLHKTREGRAFENEEEAKRVIAQDIEEVRAYFAVH